jgi:hypothetical protein
MSNEALIEALKNLPDDVKSKLASATPEQQKLFIDGLSSKVVSSTPSDESNVVENNLPKFGGTDALSRQGLNPASGIVGGDVIGTGLGVVEGLTGGIPRGIAEAVTGKNLKEFRGNVVGQGAGFLVGPTALAEKAGVSAAKKFAPEAFKTAGRLATAKSKEAMARIIPSAIKAGAIEGGVSGIVGGGLFPQEDALNVAKRAYSATVGGILGAGVGALSGGIGGFIKAKQLNKSAKKVMEKLDKINTRQPFERPTAGDIFPTKNPKTFEQAESIRLEQVKTDMTNQLSRDVDEAEGVVKELIPKWERANYDAYGNGLNNISEEMSKSGKTIKLSQLSDEINSYLKKRGLLGVEGGAEQIATSPSDRAMIKWAKDMLKYRGESGDLMAQGTSKQGGDAVVELKDVLTRMRAVKKGIPSKVVNGKAPMTPEHSNGRELDRILGNLLDDGSNVKLGELKSRYAEFADMRDFARAKFDITSDYLPKEAQGLLQKFGKGSGASMVDLTLDRGTVQKLNQLEKEVGVPFLSKLRKYGSDFDALDNNVRLLEEKAARTGVVVDAIKQRNTESFRSILDKIKVPETLARQLTTAAYAWILSKTLSNSLKGSSSESSR